MNTFTEMQDALKSANNILDKVYNSLGEYNAEKKDVAVDFEKLKFLANDNKFCGHPLCYSGGQREYLLLLAMENLMENENQENGWRHIQRVISAACPEIELSDIISDAMAITEQKTLKIVEIVKEQKLIKPLVLDTIILHKICNTENGQVLNFLADLYELMNVSKEILSESLQLTKLIVENDTETYFTKFLEWQTLKGTDHLCYMYKIDGRVFDNIADAGKCSEEKVFVVGETVKSSELIDLTNWNASIISFFKMSFEYIPGIFAQDNKKISFTRCHFKGNKVGYTINDSKLSAYLNIANSYFTNCSFEEFSDSITLLQTAGTIENCVFDKCSIETPNSYDELIDVLGGNIKNTQFKNCYVNARYRKDYNNLAVMLHMSNTVVENCQFSSCWVYVENGYGRFVSYYPKLLKLCEGSSVNSCHFENCSCDGGSASDKTQYAYIIALKEGSESNNTFDNCSCPRYSGYEYRGNGEPVGKVDR